MLTKPKRRLPLAVVFLGIIFAVGLILSGQRYFLLQAIKDAVKTQSALDESFLVAVNTGSIVSSASQSEFAKAVAVHLEQTADVRRAVSQLNVSIENSEMLSAGLWAAALAILGFLTIRDRDASTTLP